MNEEQYLQKTIQLYDDQATTFGNNVADTEPYMQFYSLFLNEISGKTVLDLGAGSGRDMLHFHQQGYSVHGIEMSSGLVAQYPVNIHNAVIVDDMRNMHHHFDQESIDGIRCFASIVHMSKTRGKEVLEKAYSLLKPGGCMLLSVKYWEDGAVEEVVKESKTIPGAVKRYVYRSKDEMTDFLAILGFRIANIQVDQYPGKDSWMVILVTKK